MISKKPIISLLLFVLFLQVKAEVCTINDPQKVYYLTPFTQIAEDDGRSVSAENIDMLVTDLPFRPYSLIDFEAQTGKSYWNKLELKSDLPLGSDYVEWVLEISGSWTHLDIYKEKTDGSFEYLRSGAFVPQTEKKFNPESEANYVKLHLPPQQIVRVFFRGKGERGDMPPNFLTSLTHLDVYYASLKSRRTSQAYYIGFILMMLAYNLTFFLLYRDFGYFYYSVYLTALIVYTSFVTGDMAEWVNSVVLLENPQYLYFGKLAIYIGLPAYFAFLRTYFDLKNLLPSWDKIFLVFSVIAFPWAVLDVILMFKTNFSYAVGDTLTGVYAVLFIVLNIAFAYSLYRTGERKGYFIVAGIIALCVGIVLTGFELMYSDTFSAIYSKAGSAAEVLLFSLGLAYRQWENHKKEQKTYFELEKTNLEKQREKEETLRLKKEDELKTEFYTNIAHEFRTPLTIIMGMNENVSGNAKEKRLIKRNSENLLLLINQMLDLSKIETGDIGLQKINADIVSYLRYLTASFYALAEEKKVQLTFYAEEKSVRMDYDEDKVRHIIYNLLSNALAFTAAGGKVILHVKKDAEYLVIKVSDTGYGIAAEDLPHLFNRFYQGKNRKLTGRTGTGIGLTLTKEFTELMQGTVGVRSRVGEGTEFTVRLPVEHQTARVTEKFINETHPETPLPTTEILENDTAAESDEREENSILLIEDSKDIVTYVKTILSGKYTVYTAKNGQEGIKKATELIPDIVVSDIMMPLQDGYEVCDFLKTDARTSHIPVILLTAKATHRDKIEGLTRGADAYLTKPFKRDELLVRIERLIHTRRLLQQRYAAGFTSIKDAGKTNALPESEVIFLQKLRAVTEKNMADSRFGPARLEKELQMSKMQIYRKLKALLDKTPSVFIRDVRLEKSRELLRESDLNISETAYEVGFSDPNYFSRTFRKKFGISPKDFRN